jgi:hypothetical protein
VYQRKAVSIFPEVKEATSGWGTLYGFLREIEDIQTLCLFQSQPTNFSEPCKHTISTGILHNAFKEQRQEDWIEKLRLARLLALAVLRFRASPWLAESWSSSDIYFFSMEEGTQQESALKFPCLNVQLSTKSATANQTTYPDFNASSIGPNPILFSLGVALIELGYDAPLQALRRDDDLKGGVSNQFTDYFTAKRLGKLVSKRLNTRYGRLVEKCLTCNFGVGNELESPELQSAVVSNVVSELEECLKAYNAFNMLGI